jgi:hypothetical protein
MLVEKAQLDNRGRAIVDLRWVVGKYRILPFTTLRKTIILIRNQNEPRIVIKPSTDEALQLLKSEGYGNPHFLVNDARKQRIREAFFKKLLNMTETYIINTRKTPEETQTEIAKILNLT